MQRCAFCHAEFEETADKCPACGQQPAAAGLDASQLSESVSSTEPLPAAAAEGATAEAVVSLAAPSGEQGSLDEDDLLTSTESVLAAPEEEPDPQSGLAPSASDDPASQNSESPTQEQIPVLASSPSEAISARSKKLWRQPSAKVLAIILAVIVVVSGSGAAFYFLTLPRPALNVSGPRQVGSTPAGSPDQFFHTSGQEFSANSAITFLLDGKAAPGAPKVQSDSNGNFTVNLPITDDWLVGSHSLTAKDAKGYVTRTAQQVQILPAPVLLITSKYQKDAIPAGSAGTSFHLSGKRFPLKVSVTLLVDSQPLPGGPFSSDARGRFEIDWTVSSDLPMGNHIVTAKDAQGNSTASGSSVTIVQQGDAGTPGPNGAPANDASFSILIGPRIQPISPPGNADALADPFQDQLIVTGQPDPAGGTVCGSNDNGQPQTMQLPAPYGGSFTVTTTYGCSGTYKYGHLTYTETVVHILVKFSSGATCTGGGYISRQLEGTFGNATTISGTANNPRAPFIPCTDGSAISISSGFSFFSPGGNTFSPDNTWTGTVESAPQG